MSDDSRTLVRIVLPLDVRIILKLRKLWAKAPAIQHPIRWWLLRRMKHFKVSIRGSKPRPLRRM